MTQPNRWPVNSARRGVVAMSVCHTRSTGRGAPRLPAFRGLDFSLFRSRDRQERKSPSPRFFRRRGIVAKGSAKIPYVDASNPMAEGAQATIAAISARYAGLIDEISNNQGMSDTQKGAAINGLRYQQERETVDAMRAATARMRDAASSGQPRMVRKDQSETYERSEAALSNDNARRAVGGKSGATAAAMRGLFQAAAQGVARRAESPQPSQRRRRGETDKGGVPPLRLIVRTAAVARGRHAGLQDRTAPADAYTSASLYLADTLDWLHLWDANADNDHWIDDAFDAKQEGYYPQP